MTMLTAGLALRALETLAHAAPTLLCGLLIAGVFERLMGAEAVRRVFGVGSWRSLPQAWLVGMLLPVCSLGALPVVIAMRRARVPAGATLAFALSAPLFNPVSVLYALTLSHPLVPLAFALCSLALVTVIGAVWGRFVTEGVGEGESGSAGEAAPQTSASATLPLSPSPTPPVPAGWRRMAATLLATGRLGAASLPYVAAALVGVMVLAALVPYGSLQASMKPVTVEPTAPLRMAAVAAPAYVTPITAMGQLGSMFDHGNSVGAGLVLLLLGAGVNAGVLVWLLRSYGWLSFLLAVTLLAATVLPLAYAVDRPLRYAGPTKPGDHTHAFDSYAFPFHETTSDIPGQFRVKLDKSVPDYEWQALYAVAGVVLLGLVLAAADPRRRLEARLATADTQPTADVTVPPWALGGVAVAGLVAFSVVACYLYYPAPADVRQDMSMAKAEVLTRAGNEPPEEVEWWLRHWDDLIRKMEVGATIRGIAVTDEHRTAAADLRGLLDRYRHAAEDAYAERTGADHDHGHDHGHHHSHDHHGHHHDTAADRLRDVRRLVVAADARLRSAYDQ